MGLPAASVPQAHARKVVAEVATDIKEGGCPRLRVWWPALYSDCLVAATETSVSYHTQLWESVKWA